MIFSCQVLNNKRDVISTLVMQKILESTCTVYFWLNLNVKEMPSIKSLINHIKTLRNNLLPLYTKMSFAIELLYMIIIASVSYSLL